MLQRILSFLSPRKRDKTSKAAVGKVQASDLGVRHRQVSRAANDVIRRLQKAKFEAYLVGGGVRDLLLGGRPKDFDVATSATPEQVKRIFRGARIIGRRFRIVHVRVGREVIEVTTFRANHEDAKHHKDAIQSDSGMLLRDNVYGDRHSDAIRRDFTINALYYDPCEDVVFDHAHGIEDLQRKKIRVIGDPATRYQEDPVRMLRAVRFAAKLGFDIDRGSREPIYIMGDLLDNIPSARLWDESMKLLMSGQAAATIEALREHQLFKHLFPGSDDAWDKHPIAAKLFMQAAKNTDDRIRERKRVTPAFIYAVLLWPEVDSLRQVAEKDGMPKNQALHQAIQATLSRQLTRISIPKRFTIAMREIWEMQLQLPRRAGQRAFKTLENPRFRAAYDFLLLRESAGENHQGLGQWWTDFQEADDETREKMAHQQHGRQTSKNGRRSPARRRPRRKPSSHVEANTASPSTNTASSSSGAGKSE